MHARLGAFFTQYEKSFWFWEIGNLVFKICITGVLCVVAQGSPFQVILALMLCLINAMFLLRWAPYDSQMADTLSILCAVVLTLTVLAGYVLMANITMHTVDPSTMDVGLIVLNVLPFICFFVNVIRLNKKYIYKYYHQYCGSRGSGGNGGSGNTRVAPVEGGNKSLDLEDRAENVDSSTIRNWKMGGSKVQERDFN